MRKIKCLLVVLSIIVFKEESNSQHVQITKEQLIALTPEWKGERFADGRPKVSDDMIGRMKSVRFYLLIIDLNLKKIEA
jgi:hypothetical protein